MQNLQQEKQDALTKLDQVLGQTIALLRELNQLVATTGTFAGHLEQAQLNAESKTEYMKSLGVNISTMNTSLRNASKSVMEISS